MDYLDRIKRGVVAGVAGGIPFGLMMALMGMLPMIGALVGRPDAVAGFGVHILMSAAIGAMFGLFVAPLARGRRGTHLAGLAYGVAWWVLGPLTFMPWLMGMGLAANWSLAGVRGSAGSLFGHLVFGAVLGYVYQRAGSSERSTPVRAGSAA